MIRSIDQSAIQEAIDVFSDLNRVGKQKLYLNRRDRPLVETRCMVFAYLREHSTLTMANLGGLFNRHHTTVIANLKNHNMYMDILSNGKRVNELYANKYLEGKAIVDQLLKHKCNIGLDLNYRVVLYTDDPNTLGNYEIVHVVNTMEA